MLASLADSTAPTYNTATGRHARGAGRKADEADDIVGWLHFPETQSCASSTSRQREGGFGRRVQVGHTIRNTVRRP